MDAKTDKQKALDERGIICDADDCGLRGTENEATQISALSMAGATVIGYVIGEGLTDAAAIEADKEG